MTKFFLLTGLLLAGLSLPAQNEGDPFFGAWTVHEIRLQFSQPGYWDSLTQNYKTDTYMRCDVSIDGQAFPQSGVKFKGNSSYNNPGRKKPFRIDFEEYVNGQALDGLKKIVLNNGFKDPSLLREKLMLDFLQAHHIAGPRATFARLYLNDHYWGLYTVVEDVNKTFLKDRYGNKDGNLFKGDPKGTLNWKGPDPALYQTDYELKTNESANDWSDLIRLLERLNNTPAAQLRDSLGRYLNLPAWIDYWAVHNLFVNLDSYIGSGHNYFLYHNTETGRFEWITWDVNEAFGNFQMDISLPNLEALPFVHIPQPMAQRPLMNRLLPDPVFKQQLAERFCELLPDFTNARLDGRIDSLATLIRPHVYADTLKFFSNTQFEQNLYQDLVPGPGAPAVSVIAGLKPFVKTRHDALRQQLLAYGCTATATGQPAASSLPHLLPNPASTYLLLETPGLLPESLRLHDAAGQTLRSWQPQPQEQQTLSLEGIPPGWYLLSVTGAAQAFVLKVLVVR